MWDDEVRLGILTAKIVYEGRSTDTSDAEKHLSFYEYYNFDDFTLFIRFYAPYTVVGYHLAPQICGCPDGVYIDVGGVSTHNFVPTTCNIFVCKFSRIQYPKNLIPRSRMDLIADWTMRHDSNDGEVALLNLVLESRLLNLYCSTISTRSSTSLLVE